MFFLLQKRFVSLRGKSACLIMLSVVLGMTGPMFAIQTHAFSESYEFIKAIQDQDYRRIKVAIERGVNVNTRNDDGTPALVLAAEKSDAPLIKYLVESGANMDIARRDTGQTALMISAELGDALSTGYLVGKGADVDQEDRHGETALMKAVRSGHSQVVKMLLAGEPDLTLEDYTGRTALEHAKQGRHRHIVKQLEDAGATY